MGTNFDNGIGLEGLGVWLEQRQAEIEAGGRAEESRRAGLIARWTQLQPAVVESIERVNAKLAACSEYQLHLSGSPDFFGEYAGYGSEYKLQGGRVI